MSLKTQIDLTKTYSLAEFMSLDEPEGFELELWEGQVKMSPSPGDEHGSVCSLLSAYLVTHAVWVNQLGKVWDNARFVIYRDPLTGKETALAPDVGFIAHPNVPPRGPGAIPRPPDLAVEVQSPSDTEPEVLDKVRKYQQAGVSLIWVIQPEKKIASIFHQNDYSPQILQAADTLEGEEIVPGFKLVLGALFE